MTCWRARGHRGDLWREPPKERSAEKVHAMTWTGLPVRASRGTESCQRRRPGDLSSRDDVPSSPCPLWPSVRQRLLRSSYPCEEPHSTPAPGDCGGVSSRLPSPAVSAAVQVHRHGRLLVHSREDQGLWSHGARIGGDPTALGLPGPCRRRSVLATEVHAARQSLREVPTRLQWVTAQVSFELTATSDPVITEGYLDGS